MTEYIEVHCTFASRQEAENVACSLCENAYAACIQIFPEIESIFIWKGKVEHAKETKMVIKTIRQLFTDVQNTVQKFSSYTVPEIYATAIVAGSQSYLEWISQAVILSDSLSKNVAFS